VVSVWYVHTNLQWGLSCVCVVQLSQHTLRSGWPDWANFRLLRGCLLWVVFSNLQK
jgi:hypothetical protein